MAAQRKALRHGLSAKVLLPDGLADAVAARTTDLTEEFEPASPYEEWLMGEMGRGMARLERFSALSIVDLQRGIDRATSCWEADRRKAADELGAKL